MGRKRTMKSYDPGNSRIEVEASQWLARLGNHESDSAASKRPPELVDWLKQSPEHVRAFLHASDAFFRLDGLTPQLGDDIRQLVNSNGANITVLPARGSSRRAIWQIKRYWPAAAAAVLIACVASLVWAMRDPQLYETATGEQRTVKLEDGSVVHLNTRSRIDIQYSSALRQISLLEGEALFTVERDAHRPFVVRTGSTSVRALGTAFNVYRRGPEVQVAVVDGRVQVSADSQTSSQHAPIPAQPMTLSAGEEAKVIAGHIARVRSAAIENSIAWRQRRLVFRDAPLAEVAAEFNRYNRTHVRVEGDALQAKPLTGIFSADHPQSLILYLSEFESLKVIPEGDDWVVRAR
jgi:transmembrane sensor